MKHQEQKPQQTWISYAKGNLFYWLVFTAVSGSLSAAILAGPLLPWRDLPDHLALISLLDHARIAGSVAAEHYQIQLMPVPYWLFYGSVWLAARILTWTAALQLVALLGMIATPLALGQLMRSLGRDPRWGLLALPLFFNHNLMYGWLSYCLGIPVLFMALASFIQVERGAAKRRGLALWSCALFLAHAQLALFFAILVAYLLLRLPRRTKGLAQRLKRVALPLSAPVALGLPWVISRLNGTHSRGEVTSGPALIFHDPVTRLKRLPDFLTNNWSGSVDDWMGLCTLATIVILLRLPTSQRLGNSSRRGIAGGLVALSVALYFVAPWEVRWPTNQWAIYNRFAILALMFAVLLIERPFPKLCWRNPSLWVLLLWSAPVLNFAKTNHSVYKKFNTNNAFVLESVGQMPSNQRILPLVQDASDPASHLGAADQFHAYYVVQKGGYDPYLFDNPSHPVIHRKSLKPTVPAWNRPQRGAALKALHQWAQDPNGKQRPFTTIIEQKRGGTNAPLSPSYQTPKRIGRWLIHRRKTP
jgi:hypothetical protein